MSRKKKSDDIADITYETYIQPEDSRIVYLVGEINELTVKSVTERLLSLSERNPKAPITLIISTLGGDVDDAFMLYDLLKYIPTPIRTVGLGKVMSAGCLLLAAGEKGHRKIGKNARMMYHGGWTAAGGSAFEIRAELEAFEKQEHQFDKCFSEETGLTIEQVEKLYDKNGPTVDHFISAQDALTLGIVDELI